jgi:hypothetical protein
MNPKFTFYPPIKREIKLNKFSVSIMDLVLFEKVKIVANMYDENDKLQENKFYTIEGEDYTKWAADDNYIVQFVKNKISEENKQATAQFVVNTMKAKVSQKKPNNQGNSNLVANP